MTPRELAEKLVKTYVGYDITHADIVLDLSKFTSAIEECIEQFGKSERLRALEDAAQIADQYPQGEMPNSMFDSMVYSVARAACPAMASAIRALKDEVKS